VTAIAKMIDHSLLRPEHAARERGERFAAPAAGAGY